jgi:hypothetical protein
LERVGRDRVHREGRRVIVQSPREMRDWYASSFRRVEVRYEGERYFVAEATRGGDRRMRYVLEPWPPELADRPSRSIVYGEEYVRLRDGGRGPAWVGLALWPLQAAAGPILGCLWCRPKRWLEPRVGMDASRATQQSLFGEYLLALCLVVLSWLSLLDRSLIAGASPLAPFGAALLLLADAVMRYDHLQDRPEDLLGVGEWIARIARGRR